MDEKKLKKAIVAERGNLTRAASVLDISKTHVMNLVRRWKLNDWARTLRVQNGFPPTGNPTSNPRRIKKAALGAP